MNNGDDYDHPKKYITGLSKTERMKLFPDNTYIINSKNQICIMTNGRPQFTNDDGNKTSNKSKCSGKLNILLCPEKDCVWHSKSNQCRNRKNASKKIIEEDSLHRKLYIDKPMTIFNVKKQKSKVVRLMQLLIEGYHDEDDLTYLQHVIKKLNKLLVKIDTDEGNYTTPSFSLSDYDDN
jgi:hypothetical protein